MNLSGGNPKTDQADQFSWLDQIEQTRDLQRGQFEEKIRTETMVTDHDGDMDVKDEDARQGRRIHADELMAVLRKMKPNLIFRRAPALYPRNGKMVALTGVYIPEYGFDPTTMGFKTTERHLCSMESGWMPEFTIVHTEEVELPSPGVVGERVKVNRFQTMTRGWRGVLVMLLRRGVITIGDVEKHFNISRGPDSEYWKETVAPGTIHIEKGAENNGDPERSTDDNDNGSGVTDTHRGETGRADDHPNEGGSR